MTTRGWACIFGGYPAGLSGAILVVADLRNDRLIAANLRGADLRYADLKGAIGMTNEKLAAQTDKLENVTMPNGQHYEDWLKSKSRKPGNP